MSDMDNAAEQGSAHLLVVDDDREIRDLLGRFLRRRGFRVTAAQDGREMRRALDDWNIDMIILDLMLPGEDGLTLTRDLRGKHGDIPIILRNVCSPEHVQETRQRLPSRKRRTAMTTETHGDSSHDPKKEGAA